MMTGNGEQWHTHVENDGTMLRNDGSMPGNGGNMSSNGKNAKQSWEMMRVEKGHQGTVGEHISFFPNMGLLFLDICLHKQWVEWRMWLGNVGIYVSSNLKSRQKSKQN